MLPVVLPQCYLYVTCMMEVRIESRNVCVHVGTLRPAFGAASTSVPCWTRRRRVCVAGCLCVRASCRLRSIIRIVPIRRNCFARHGAVLGGPSSPWPLYSPEPGPRGASIMYVCRGCCCLHGQRLMANGMSFTLCRFRSGHWRLVCSFSVKPHFRKNFNDFASSGLKLPIFPEEFR